MAFDKGATLRPNSSCISVQRRESEMTGQWLLENAFDGGPPMNLSSDNRLRVFICGEEAFRQLAADIGAAQRSIDLVCWGFDPGMNLVRDGADWHRERSFGHLLEEAARRGVLVRMLVWRNWLGSRAQKNIIADTGLGPVLTSDEISILGGGFGGVFAPARRLKPPSVERYDYCVEWFRKARAGAVPALRFATRDGDKQSIRKSLESEADQPSTEGIDDEKFFIEQFGTHHQKTVLIDYEAPNIGVGYVMGLNSVTDYWDGEQHLIDDPRREPETDAKARAKGFNRLKPYQDYACRIAGGSVLKEVDDNFIKAWERAAKELNQKLVTQRIAPVARVEVQDPASPAPAAAAGSSTRHSKGKSAARLSRAQILRTQPEEQEKSIKAFYQHASEVAVDYLYIENQYFFYPEWAQHLKASRKKWVEDWQEKYRNTPDAALVARLSPRSMPLLHVMVVIPEPERDEMVPRTYETMRHLGQEGTMRAEVKDDKGNVKKDAQGNPIFTGQDVWISGIGKRYEDDVRAYRSQLATHKDAVRQAMARGHNPAVIRQPTPPEQPASQTARDALKIAPISAATLEKVHGMKVCTAMLYSSGVIGGQMKYRDIYIHSKLMIHSDACFTLGSANVNQRSMSVDSEINIASDCAFTTRELRERVFRLHSGGDVLGGTGQDVAAKTFRSWIKRMNENKLSRDNGQGMKGFLIPFEELRVVEKRYA